LKQVRKHAPDLVVFEDLNPHSGHFLTLCQAAPEHLVADALKAAAGVPI
tara:strand:+ start:531 stop:677 length:147 start_codon:yes stop_codon:yes gene_type:complete